MGPRLESRLGFGLRLGLRLGLGLGLGFRVSRGPQGLQHTQTQPIHEHLTLPLAPIGFYLGGHLLPYDLSCLCMWGLIVLFISQECPFGGMMTAELSAGELFTALNALCQSSSAELVATLPNDIDDRARRRCLQEFEAGRFFPPVIK